jgi:hypothetical protein
MISRRKCIMCGKVYQEHAGIIPPTSPKCIDCCPIVIITTAGHDSPAMRRRWFGDASWEENDSER